MTEEQRAALLAMLKIDLGITADAYDVRLGQYVEAASAYITDEGAVLDLDDVKDMQLAVMYAAWLWRRRDSGEGMPRMLRFALNNKIFHGHMAEG